MTEIKPRYSKRIFIFSFFIVTLLLFSFPTYYLSSSSSAKKSKSYGDVVFTDPGISIKPIASGFGFPTGMAFIGPDDILVIEKNTGNVIRIQNGIVLDRPLLHVNVANMSERGLLGIAISEENNSSAPRYVFLYYTETDGNSSQILGNRLYRYQLVNGTLVNPKLLLDLPYLPGPSHDGGVLKIGPDKKSVYLIIGNLNFIQNISYMTKAQNVKDGPPPDGRGGILRVTFDGDVVGGKGILGDSAPLNKYYGYGLRNSFGLGFDSVTGNLWDTENGQSKYDEINLVKPGFNSGWRVIQGPSFLQKDFERRNLEDFNKRGVYRDPEFNWLDTVAPTSVLFFNSDKLGDKYENDLFIGSVKNGTIFHFDLSKDREHLDLEGPLADRVGDNTNELRAVTFAKGLGLITDLERGPDGNFYVLSDYKRDGTLFQLTPIGNTTISTKNPNAADSTSITNSSSPS